MQIHTLVILTLLTLPATSYAIEPYTCRNGAFPTYTELNLGEIVAGKGERVHARDDMDGCPDQKKCIQKGYLINGDKVLTAHPSDGWVCIYYFRKKSEYTGWIPQKNVRTTPFPKNPELRSWIGHWEADGGTPEITISLAKKNKLKVSGEAYWQAFVNSLPHIGLVDGVAAPVGNKLTVKEEGDESIGCVVNFELIGPYLVANDNRLCGGANVSFDAIYRRKP